MELNPFKIDENENICSINSSWFSLKNFKTGTKPNLFKLNEGDVIKIGKIIIRIRKIKFNKNKKNKITTNNSSDCISSISSEKINNLKEIGTNLGTQNNKNNDNDNSDDKNDDDDLFLFKNNKEEDNKNENKNGNEIGNEIKEEKNNEEQHAKSDETIQKLCRICYLDDDTDKNPLIQPCQCSGSMKYIHLNCLKQWIGTRNYINIESSEFCSIFLIKEVDCELCKNKLPDYIKHNNKLYRILEFHTEFKNYMSFENLTLDRQRNKFIYLINLDKNQRIKMGRGHESNILLSDISVSRIHCLLNVENNNVFLEDNNSKYGTLVLIQAPKINLVDSLSLNIQVGRTFINCKVKKPFKFFGCCGYNEKIENNFYYKQNDKYIGTKKVLTVKTEVENKAEEDSDKGVEMDIDVDEDVNVNKSCISFSKYYFRSNENCKLLNSISYKNFDFVSIKNTCRSNFANDINNTDVIPITLRTGRIFNKLK